MAVDLDALMTAHKAGTLSDDDFKAQIRVAGKVSEPSCEVQAYKNTQTLNIMGAHKPFSLGRSKLRSILSLVPEIKKFCTV